MEGELLHDGRKSKNIEINESYVKIYESVFDISEEVRLTLPW